MKRALIFLLASLTLAACGQQESSPAATQAEPAASASAAAAAPAPVAAVSKSGEDVYKQVCLSCHAHGVAGAPKSGEPGGWASLADEGQATVTAHGWVGIRGMPGGICPRHRLDGAQRRCRLGGPGRRDAGRHPQGRSAAPRGAEKTLSRAQLQSNMTAAPTLRPSAARML